MLGRTQAHGSVGNRKRTAHRRFHSADLGRVATPLPPFVKVTTPPPSVGSKRSPETEQAPVAPSLSVKKARSGPLPSFSMGRSFPPIRDPLVRFGGLTEIPDWRKEGIGLLLDRNEPLERRLRPISRSDLVGQRDHWNDRLDRLADLIRAGDGLVLISGPNGCGKTCSALALLSDMGWIPTCLSMPDVYYRDPPLSSTRSEALNHYLGLLHNDTRLKGTIVRDRVPCGSWLGTTVVLDDLEGLQDRRPEAVEALDLFLQRLGPLRAPVLLISADVGFNGSMIDLKKRLSSQKRQIAFKSLTSTDLSNLWTNLSLPIKLIRNQAKSCFSEENDSIEPRDSLDTFSGIQDLIRSCNGDARKLLHGAVLRLHGAQTVGDRIPNDLFSATDFVLGSVSESGSQRGTKARLNAQLCFEFGPDVCSSGLSKILARSSLLPTDGQFSAKDLQRLTETLDGFSDADLLGNFVVGDRYFATQHERRGEAPPSEEDLSLQFMSAELNSMFLSRASRHLFPPKNAQVSTFVETQFFLGSSLVTLQKAKLESLHQLNSDFQIEFLNSPYSQAPHPVRPVDFSLVSSILSFVPRPKKMKSD